MPNTRRFAMAGYAAALLLAAVSLIGCSGLRTYPNDLEKNLVIRTNTDAGSMFSKVRADVEIFGINANCETEYHGTVSLNKPSVEVGIPPEKLSYMVFVFSNSSFLFGSSSTMRHETLLKARAGHTYDIEVSYIDDIYNMAISEKRPGAPKARKIALRSMGACEGIQARLQ